MAKTAKTGAVAKEQTSKQLEEQLVAKQADLLAYKKGLAGGELKNTGIIKATKRDIARIKTALSMNTAGKEGDK